MRTKLVCKAALRRFLKEEGRQWGLSVKRISPRLIETIEQGARQYAINAMLGNETKTLH